MMYEALTGDLPYELSQGPLTKDVLEAVKHQRPVRARHRKRSLSRDIDYVLHRGLAKDPDERYPTMRALITDIEAALNQRPIAGRIFSPVIRSGWFVRRHRIALLLLHRREANMTHLVRSLVHIGIAMFDNPSSPVQLRENIDNDLPPVRIDHGRFREIIYQVLKNALDAMSGKGTLQVWANSVSSQDLRPHHKSDDSDFIRLRFIDNGVGIEPNLMNRVFDPFCTTSSRAEKRGLGLSVVQGIVAQHGGWIELHSIKDQGTEVRIFLPAHIPENKTGELDPEEALPVTAAARAGRMLIADDEAFIRQLVSRIFEQEGWLIDEAISHEEVIQLATRHPNYYQLIMLDLTMPGPPPEESVKEITRQSPDTRIVLMSGLQRATRVDQLIELGAKSFIPKPFSPKKMIAVVDEVLAHTSPPES